jgi:type IV secretory pathway VirJ component
MDGQGLQPVRSEIEAIVTFQAALNRLALHVDEDALTEWTGPRPDDVDALAGDDGTFSREELNEVRKLASDALTKRFHEVLASVTGNAPVYAVLKRAVLTGTGGVVSLEGPRAEAVLAALSRTGAIRQDWAQSAANQVKEELAALSAAVAAPSAPQPASKPAARKPKAKAKTVKKPVARKSAVKKAATKKAVTKKAVTKKKPAARKPAPKRPAAKKKAPAAKAKKK